MADVQIRGLGTSSAPLSYTVPGSQQIIVKALYASFDGGGAATQFYPCVRVIAPGGGIAGEYIAETAIDPGGSGDVSWAPFLRTVTPGETFPRNMGELGFTGSGTLSDTYTHTIQYEDAQIGDCVLVSAQAPSVSAALATPGRPITCDDSAGTSYSLLSLHRWEANPPNVNEGASQTFFISDVLTSPLLEGVGTITVEWGQPVFDRSVYAWLIRHDGGSPDAALVAATASNDAAVFASNQVTQQSPSYTPTRSNGLLFATIFSAKAGGTGSFGGVVGFTGYLQVNSRSFTGSKQTYRISQQTYGANALQINPFVGAPFEIDLGQLPAGVNVAAFNGVGQFYTAGANAWKGIAIFSID